MYYCAGTELTLQSSSITLAVYESNWIIASSVAKKGLILIMQRSNQPIEIKTPFNRICNETFTDVKLYIIFFAYWKRYIKIVIISGIKVDWFVLCCTKFINWKSLRKLT